MDKIRLSEGTIYDEGKYTVLAGYPDISEQTDDPKRAVKLWFRFQKKYPNDVWITAESVEDARALVNAIDDDYILELDERFPQPYKIDWLLDTLHKQQENGCRGFAFEGDSVVPFTFG
jgi:hypothetical protein